MWHIVNIFLLAMMLTLSTAFQVQRGLRKSFVKSSYFRIVSSTSLSLSESNSGHGSSASAPELSPEDAALVEKFKSHQSAAARISFAEEVRTLIDRSLGYGVLSTNSDAYGGYPTGKCLRCC
jgi:hypothetical protein